MATGIGIQEPGTPGAKVVSKEVQPSGDPEYVQHVQTVEAGYESLGHQTLTVDNTADALPSIPSDADHALVSVETAALRWRDDGTDPTNTVGHLLTPPASDAVYFWIAGRSRLLDFKMIRTGATSAAVQVTYYKGLIPV